MSTPHNVLLLLAISFYSLSFVFAIDIGRRLRIPGVAMIGAAILARVATVTFSFIAANFDAPSWVVTVERVYGPLCVAVLACFGFGQLAYSLRRTQIRMPRDGR